MDTHATDSQSLTVCNGLLREARASLDDARAECGRLLDKTVTQSDTIRVLNAEAIDLRNRLSRAESCLGHLEYGISEYRRVERNAAEARAAQDTEAA